MTEDPAGVTSPPPSGNCRVCGDASWLADETGPVHLCCARWEVEHPGRACAACRQADENRTAQQRRRRPRLLP
jgi:hypothetical protein